MRKIIPFLLMILIPTISAIIVIDKNANFNDCGTLDLDTVFTRIPSVDHSQFDILKQEFDSAQQITASCLSCHTNRGAEIICTSHWKWERDDYIEGKGVVSLGKKNILNNFCIGVSGSEATCTRCHIGYGWKDKSFDFSNENNIDCLICHDQTKDYKKAKGVGGYPAEGLDLNHIAQNVGLPTKHNCGICHFWGGGGNNVKHGDLEIALLDCSKEVDVHMGVDGMNMECTDCHVTENHNIPGKVYALSSENKNRTTCEQCHGETPHKNKLINDHNYRVSCQTCHIPIYAKVNSTKMIWDWSTAGELDDEGHPKHWNDQDGNHKYMGIKGTFIWDDHVVPEYYWFNGKANHQLISDKIDTTNLPLQMNTLYGSYCDTSECSEDNPKSKIWPVKVHRGKQIYDTKNLTLIQPKLWDKEEGQGAYWVDFNWDDANQKGMQYVGQDYSGEYGFIETEMYWPLNHMVSIKEEALTCRDCHVRENGRLASLNDFYMPGRDRIYILDLIGILMIIGSILGVSIHAYIRISASKKRKAIQ